MKCAQGVVGLVVIALAVSEASAQGIFIGYSGGRGFGWASTRSGRSLSYSGTYGGLSGYGSSLGYSSVTIVQPYVSRSIIIVVVPRELLSRDRNRDRDREEEAPEGVVRIRPRLNREQERDREKEQEREFVEEKIKPPRPIEPSELAELVPPPQLLEQPRLKMPEPMKPRPVEDPREASARHIGIGKDAFAVGEYGRAAFRFQKATELTPDQALPHFLSAQASLALGKYRDAVSAVYAGMALDPTWPATGSRFAALYGQANNEFALHLQQLGAARDAHPDDPVLLFLQGVTLWFDGRQDDARLLFEKAAPRVPDRRDIDRFLQK
jgi:hypothetical protein